jgi:hypothetical protein
MKLTVFKAVLAINIATLAILLAVWWVNGRDDTWLYLFAAAIALSSFLYVKPPKKDDEQ